ASNKPIFALRLPLREATPLTISNDEDSNSSVPNASPLSLNDSAKFTFSSRCLLLEYSLHFWSDTAKRVIPAVQSR
ncbi:hypothetical protein CU098_007255, partial [Rhizopus stolonifer]